MSSASRREVVQAGAGVAAVAPFLNVAQANAARTMEAKVIICGLCTLLLQSEYGSETL